MDVCSADFLKFTLQDVADLLVDQDKHCALCRGTVDGVMYGLKVELIVDE